MTKYCPAGDTDSVQDISGMSSSPLVCRNHQFSVVERSDFVPEPPNCLINNNNASFVKRVRQGMSKVFHKDKNIARTPLLNQMQGNHKYEFSVQEEFDKNEQTRSSWDIKTNYQLEEKATPVLQSPTSVAAPTSHFFGDSDKHQSKEEEPTSGIYAVFSHSISWSSASSFSSAAASGADNDEDDPDFNFDEWKYISLPDHNHENDPIEKEDHSELTTQSNEVPPRKLNDSLQKICRRRIQQRAMQSKFTSMQTQLNKGVDNGRNRTNEAITNQEIFYPNVISVKNYNTVLAARESSDQRQNMTHKEELPQQVFFPNNYRTSRERETMYSASHLSTNTKPQTPPSQHFNRVSKIPFSKNKRMTPEDCPSIQNVDTTSVMQLKKKKEHLNNETVDTFESRNGRDCDEQRDSCFNGRNVDEEQEQPRNDCEDDRESEYSYVQFRRQIRIIGEEERELEQKSNLLTSAYNEDFDSTALITQSQVSSVVHKENFLRNTISSKKDETITVNRTKFPQRNEDSPEFQVATKKEEKSNSTTLSFRSEENDDGTCTISDNYSTSDSEDSDDSRTIDDSFSLSDEDEIYYGGVRPPMTKKELLDLNRNWKASMRLAQENNPHAHGKRISWWDENSNEYVPFDFKAEDFLLDFYKLQDTAYKLQDTASKLQDTAVAHVDTLYALATNPLEHFTRQIVCTQSIEQPE